MPDPVTEKVISTLASVKHIPRENISLESSLPELGFDSLDTITLLFELESQFKVSISDEAAKSIRCVRDIVDGINQLSASAAAGTPAPAE
jgi:acyl carrier protein